MTAGKLIRIPKDDEIIKVILEKITVSKDLVEEKKNKEEKKIRQKKYIKDYYNNYPTFDELDDLNKN